MSGVRISRAQVIRCLRDAGWMFEDQTVRVEIYRKAGLTDRVVVAKKDALTETQVRVILSDAKFSRQQVEQFLLDAVSS